MSEPAIPLALSPWMQELIERYPPGRMPKRAAGSAGRLSTLLIIAAAGVAGVALWPAAVAGYHAAYPRDPEQQQALDACSREDPTFIRFLPGSRTACYERFSARLHAAAGSGTAR